MSRERIAEQTRTKGQEPGQAKRLVRLERGEYALSPDWGKAPAIAEYLAAGGVSWRTDPVLQCIIVDKKAVASELERDYGCTDVSQYFRDFLSQEQGVRVVGCDAFGGMLAYNLEDDVLYHVDALSFSTSPVPDIHVAYTFDGLGRPPHRDQSQEYPSLEVAIDEFKRYARGAQRRWLRKGTKGSKKRDAKRSPA